MKLLLSRIQTGSLRLILTAVAGLVLMAGCLDFEPLMKVDPNVPLETIEEAGVSDDPALVSPLLQYLQLRATHSEDGLNSDRTQEVIISLTRRDVHEAVPFLIRILRDDDDDDVLYQATVSLGRLGGREAETALFQCIVNKSQSPFVRKRAEKALTEALNQHLKFSPPDSHDPGIRLKKWKAWWKENHS